MKVHHAMGECLTPMYVYTNARIQTKIKAVVASNVCDRLSVTGTCNTHRLHSASFLYHWRTATFSDHGSHLRMQGTMLAFRTAGTAVEC